MKKKKRRKSSRKRYRNASVIKRFFRKWLRRLRLLVSICIGVVIVGAGVLAFNLLTEGAGGGRRTVKSSDYNGIDVSKYQGNIDWEEVAQDRKIQFVYIKASEGASQVDKRYRENVTGARRAALKVGSYHYFIGRKSAQEQFRNFNENIVKWEQDLIPMVDVEESGNRLVSRSELQRNLAEFMELIKEEYGTYPLLYSQYGFYKRKLSPEFDRYFLFIARYSKKPPTLNGNTRYNIWQYTQKGRISGIKGDVDLDRFNTGTTLSDIEL